VLSVPHNHSFAKSGRGRLQLGVIAGQLAVLVGDMGFTFGSPASSSSLEADHFRSPRVEQTANRRSAAQPSRR